MGDIPEIKEYQNQLVHYSKLLSQKGLTYSVFGNISVKVKDGMVIKRRGVSLELAQLEDFMYVPLKIDLPHEIQSQLSSEWRLHCYCYLSDVRYKAVFHLHPFYISLLEDLGIPLECEEMEFKYLLSNKIARLDYFQPGSEKLAREVARCISDFPFLVLKNHGIVVAGEDLYNVYNLCWAGEVMAKRIFFKKYFLK
jgi:L-fuculose-phosphate aldolase